MNRHCLSIGTRSLREIALPVADVATEVVKKEACRLKEALGEFRRQYGFGRAMAAPQIGIGKRIIALAIPEWPDVIFNPEIVWLSDELMTLWDDCMCFPEMLVRVERHVSVSVRYTDGNGNHFLRETLHRDLSELMQHEIDHLNGKLSFDRATGVNPYVHRDVYEADPAAFGRDVDYMPATTVKQHTPGRDIGRIDGLTYPSGVAYMAGQFMPMSEARISVLDWGLLHSDVTYDTVHVWNGKFFRLDQHIARFRRSLRKLRLSVSFTDTELADILVECVRRSGLRNAYVEMLCTRGLSPTFSRDPREAINQFVAFAVPYSSVANARQLKEGLHLHLIDDVRRIPAESVDPQIKNYHWLDLVTALFKGYDAGAETVVIKCTDGSIAEGPGFNIFVVKNGILFTPEHGVLHGITRQSVCEIANEIGVELRTGSVNEHQLVAADEIFVTSTAGGIMPVSRLNGHPVGNAGTEVPGVITGKIFDVYWAKHDDPAWTLAIAYSDEID